MRRFIEVVSNIVIILIVALCGSAIGYYAAGYAPKRDAASEPRYETNGAQARAEPVRLPPGAINNAIAIAAMPSPIQGPPPQVQPTPAPLQAVALAPRNEAEERAQAAGHRSRVQSRYNACLQRAEQSFTQSWDETCKSSGEEGRKSYQQCLKTVGQTKATCSRTHAALPERNCKLPSNITDRLGTKLQSSAHRCLLEMQAGLE